MSSFDYFVENLSHYIDHLLWLIDWLLVGYVVLAALIVYLFVVLYRIFKE